MVYPADVLKRGVGMNFTDTRGNNAFVQANPTGGNEFELNYRPSCVLYLFADS